MLHKGMDRKEDKHICLTCAYVYTHILITKWETYTHVYTCVYVYTHILITNCSWQLQSSFL